MTEKRKDFVFPNGSSLGISKLEYFAGLALQGLLANSEFCNNHDHSDIVEYAVYFAKKLSIELKEKDK